MAKTYDVKWSLGVDDQTAEGLESAIKNMTSPMEKMQKQWGGFIRASGINAYVELVQKGFRAMQVVGEQYTQFLAQEDRKLAFANLAESVGSNSEKIIASIKRASHETISYEQIIDSASRALFQGLKPEQLEKIMNVARLAVKVTGHDLPSAFENLSRAVATNTERLSRSEGVILDVKKGQTVYQAMLEKSIELNKKFGNSVDSYNERYKRAGTSIADSSKEMKDSIMGIATPAVVASLETTASLLEKINKAMQMPKGARSPEEMLNQPRTFYNKTAMGEGASSQPDWAITRADIEKDMSKYNTEYWIDWEKKMEKAVDNYGKAILKSLDETHPLPKYIDDPANMEKLVDNAYKAMDEGMKQAEQAASTRIESAKTFGTRFGESFGEGFAFGAKNAMSNGIYDFITDAFNKKSFLSNTLKLGARMLSESFSEAFLETLGVKFSLSKFFIGLFSSAGQSTGFGIGTGGGAGGGILSSPGGGIGKAAVGQRHGGQINNTFNYYITDDPTLQKRINEGVRKSFRENNLRQDVKGLN